METIKLAISSTYYGTQTTTISLSHMEFSAIISVRYPARVTPSKVERPDSPTKLLKRAVMPKEEREVKRGRTTQNTYSSTSSKGLTGA